MMTIDEKSTSAYSIDNQSYGNTSNGLYSSTTFSEFCHRSSISGVHAHYESSCTYSTGDYQAPNLGSGHVDLLMLQIAQRNRLPVHQLNVFIQTLPVKDVVMFRQQLADHRLTPNQWISVPRMLTIKSEQNIHLLAAIFEYSIAGQLSFESLVSESERNFGRSELDYPTVGNVSFQESSSMMNLMFSSTPKNATWKIVSITATIGIVLAIAAFITAMQIFKPTNPSPIPNTTAVATANRTTIATICGILTTASPDSTMLTSAEMATSTVSPSTTTTTICAIGWIYYEETNSCYLLQQVETDWNYAQFLCNQSGANLVSINSTKENNFVTELVTNATNDNTSDVYTWIGLSRSDIRSCGSQYSNVTSILMHSCFDWTDKTPNDYRNWADGEPDNHYGNEYCVALERTASADLDGTWSDVYCKMEGVEHYVCKKPL